MCSATHAALAHAYLIASLCVILKSDTSVMPPSCRAYKGPSTGPMLPSAIWLAASGLSPAYFCQWFGDAWWWWVLCLVINDSTIPDGYGRLFCRHVW
jgi:hypothetical protein